MCAHTHFKIFYIEAPFESMTNKVHWGHKETFPLDAREGEHMRPHYNQ